MAKSTRNQGKKRKVEIEAEVDELPAHQSEEISSIPPRRNKLAKKRADNEEETGWEDESDGKEKHDENKVYDEDDYVGELYHDPEKEDEDEEEGEESESESEVEEETVEMISEQLKSVQEELERKRKQNAVLEERNARLHTLDRKNRNIARRKKGSLEFLFNGEEDARDVEIALLKEQMAKTEMLLKEERKKYSASIDESEANGEDWGEDDKQELPLQQEYGMLENELGRDVWNDYQAAHVSGSGRYHYPRRLY